MQNTEIKKLSIHKECQTDFDIRRNTIRVLEDMNGEKEMDLFKMKSKFEILKKEKLRLEECLVRSNNLLEEIERKNGPNEIEIAHLRQANIIYEDKLHHAEDRLENLDKKLDQTIEKNFHLKKVINSLKDMLKKKKTQLQDSLDQLYNTQVI